MVMDEHEILFSYKNAADQKKQVQILADLNDVGVWEMATWLKKHGAEIKLQRFQKYNPNCIRTTSGGERKEKENPSEDQDAPTREQYEEALRGIIALREELSRGKAELRRARSEGEQELSTAERKLNRIKSILTAFYKASVYDAATALMIIDLIAREGDE